MSTLLWSSPRTPLSSAVGIGAPAASNIINTSDTNTSASASMVHMHPPNNHRVAFGASSFANTLSSTSSSASSPFGTTHAANSTSSGQGSTSSAGGFGFGFGYNASSSVAGSISASGSMGSTSFKSPNPAGITSPSANRRRRRRSDSPSEEMMQDIVDDTALVGKRARREIRPIKSMANLLSSSQDNPQSTSGASGTNVAANEVDLGKALASLSKPALLSVLTSLLTNQPSLKPSVLALLPPPSLEAITSTIQTFEKKVLDALPSGTSLRDEYVWSRIRSPLEDYIAEARLALSQFCTSHNGSPSSGSDEAQHPTAIFAFLNMLTHSIRRLELLLPRAPQPFGSPSSTNTQPSINHPSTLNQRDPLQSFLPSLFNQWHILVTRLSTLVNQSGCILSADMLRNWFKTLDTLVDISSTVVGGTNNLALEAKDSISVGRKASESIRERFIKELGWLVGIKANTSSPASTTQSVPRFSQHQSVAAVANQMMDSRMMMADDNDEFDEEL